MHALTRPDGFRRRRYTVAAALAVLIAMTETILSLADPPAAHAEVVATANAVTIAAPTGVNGYTLLDANGNVYNFGTAYLGGSPQGATLPFVGMAYTPSGNGYALLDSAGHVYNYGDSQFKGGNPTGATLPFRAIAYKPGTLGYTLTDSAGHIYNYGTDYLGGSPGGATLPFRSLVYTPSGLGYTLMDSAGNIYNYGDSAYRGGSPSGAARPMSGLAEQPGTNAYTEIDAVGHVYNYGTAYLGGSPAGASTFVGIVYTPSGKGYTLADNVGHIYNYGDSTYRGGFDRIGTPAPPPSTAQDLARQILANPRIARPGRLVTDDLQRTANGQVGTNGYPLSAAVLRLVVALAQNHTVTINALESGGTGHSPGSLHYYGDAVDFGPLDGQTIQSVTGRDTNAVKEINETKALLPAGSGYGQIGCGPQKTPPLPSGVGEFTDRCNHLHVQVPRGTP